MTFFNPVPLKLLIVDDDPMMRLGLTAALGNQDDFKILGKAAGGRQGLEQTATL
jgi:DNA-binding NarL/FixJ family response regulator